MSSWLVALTGLIYLWVSIEQFWIGHPQMGVVYLGYAFSNVGLYFAVK